MSSRMLPPPTGESTTEKPSALPVSTAAPRVGASSSAQQQPAPPPLSALGIASAKSALQPAALDADASDRRKPRATAAAGLSHEPLLPLPQAFQSHITMSMNVNITTSSSMNNSRPVVNISAKPVAAPMSINSINNNSSNNNNSGHSPSSVGAHVVFDTSSGLPPLASAGHAHVHSSGGGRKRKSSHSKKSNNNSKEKDNDERAAPASTGSLVSSVSTASSGSGGTGPMSTGGGGGHSSSSSSSGKAKSPFEKLNTLKLLLDCGHLTADEYHERKTQIINEMTGTSTERKKPSPRRALQPIMKTVVPHHPPDFARLAKERAEKLSFDVDTLEWHSTSTRVKLDLVPFATGQLRNAYYLQELEEGATDANVTRLLVAKFSIRQAEPSSYLSDVEMQAVCAHYAELYNEHEPPLRVYYARSWLLKLRDRGDLVCSVEEYLPGAYVKYSNNNGYVGKETSSTEERERNTPQAFSHFTFVASDYQLMVVDIQGVNDSYTDPQIHTADGRGFGAGNLGTFGMEKFLESHRCNEVCKWLGLRSINERYKCGGTAAPLYEMPFGSAIKKSTNRITEERNTFSTSVTVSEAFGSDALQRTREDDELLRASTAGESTTTAATGSSSAASAVSSPVASMRFASSIGSRFGFDAGLNGGGASGIGNGSGMVSLVTSGHPRSKGIGRPRKVLELDDHGPPAWWLALKRLLCCCYSV